MVEKEGLSLVLYVESFLCPQGFLEGIWVERFGKRRIFYGEVKRRSVSESVRMQVWDGIW